ncbi:MAG: sugar phosphate isomerase/epimerase family protein [Cyclobacteriaceae bacterium]
MKNRFNRRGFIKGTALAGGAALLGRRPSYAAVHERANSTNRLKIGLNAYTFNAPLRDGSMTIDDMLEFCAENGFYACDITAYYFPGYPEVCNDEYLYHIKHKAFSLGQEISGIGVRNDFAQPDPAKRKEHVTLVKNWIEAAEKLGAPVIRVFAGAKLEDESQRPEVLEWMIKDMQECAAYGKVHGVMVAVQNHHDFLLTPDHTKELIDGVNSKWFGLILDTGGYRSGDPYQQIAESIDFAVNWQIKEKIFVNGEEVDTDLKKLVHVIKHSNYRGYLPIETLGSGDPKAKAKKLVSALNAALA